VRTVTHHGWCSGTNRCITRDRRCPRAIRCHLGRCCVGTQHKRVGGRPDSDEAVGQVRASRTRVGGFQGCSLTISWLQRLARGIFSHPGHSLLRRKSRRSVARVRTARAGVPSPRQAGGSDERQGCSSCEVGFIHDFDRSATPCRKIGIKPIEGILG
jgi:hypothetical protein